MDEYHKIAVKNVAVVNVCLRMEDKLYNEGRIILDIDTYDFAGRLTDEVIIGLYDNGKYNIYYYHTQYDFCDGEDVVEYDTVYADQMKYEYKEYEIELSVLFQKNKLPDDFTAKMISFTLSNDIAWQILNSYEGKLTIAFDGFETDMRAIQNCLNTNADLIEQRV